MKKYPIGPNEEKVLNEVRRWRKEAYEEVMRMTFEERVRHDQEVAERMGLSHLPIAKTVQPVRASDAEKPSA